MLAADVGAHINAIFVAMGAWLWPFTITTAAWLLYREIGPAAYPGVAAMVFLQLVYLALDTVNGLLRQPYMEAKDERMSRLSEAFVHVRSLRVNNWRDPMAQHVQAARDSEMSYLATREYMTSVQGGLGYVHATLVRTGARAAGPAWDPEYVERSATPRHPQTAKARFPPTNTANVPQEHPTVIPSCFCSSPKMFHAQQKRRPRSRSWSSTSS